MWVYVYVGGYFMSKRNFVYLSSKSLKIVWNWCESNADDPLAIAYNGACIAIGNFNYSDIAERLDESWSKKKYVGYKVGRELSDQCVQYRDTLGRVIFDMIKRNAKVIS